MMVTYRIFDNTSSQFEELWRGEEVLSLVSQNQRLIDVVRTPNEVHGISGFALNRQSIVHDAQRYVTELLVEQCRTCIINYNPYSTGKVEKAVKARKCWKTLLPVLKDLLCFVIKVFKDKRASLYCPDIIKLNERCNLTNIPALKSTFGAPIYSIRTIISLTPAWLGETKKAEKVTFREWYLQQ